MAPGGSAAGSCRPARVTTSPSLRHRHRPGSAARRCRCAPRRSAGPIRRPACRSRAPASPNARLVSFGLLLRPSRLEARAQACDRATRGAVRHGAVGDQHRPAAGHRAVASGVLRGDLQSVASVPDRLRSRTGRRRVADAGHGTRATYGVRQLALRPVVAVSPAGAPSTSDLEPARPHRPDRSPTPRLPAAPRGRRRRERARRPVGSSTGAASSARLIRDRPITRLAPAGAVPHGTVEPGGPQVMRRNDAADAQPGPAKRRCRDPSRWQTPGRPTCMHCCGTGSAELEHAHPRR